MAWKIVSHLIYMILGGVLTFMVWLIWFAEPLAISRLDFDKEVYQPGENFQITSTSKKALWAARLCEATKATLFIADEFEITSAFDEQVNFNDGSITTVRSSHRIPKRLEPGPIHGWKRVAYICFGFIPITITSDRRHDAKAFVVDEAIAN